MDNDNKNEPSNEEKEEISKNPNPYPFRFKYEKWLLILLSITNVLIVSWIIYHIITTKHIEMENTDSQLMRISSKLTDKSFDYYNDHQHYQKYDEQVYFKIVFFLNSINNFYFFLIQGELELYTDMTEVIINLIGLIAVIKEHDYLSILYVLLGSVNLVVVIVMYTEIQDEKTLGQMILIIILYSVLLVFVYDLLMSKMRKRRQEAKQKQSIHLT